MAPLVLKLPVLPGSWELDSTQENLLCAFGEVSVPPFLFLNWG